MSPNPVSVAPSPGSSDRSNPVVLPPGGTFELRLDLPEGAHDVNEAWELRSTDGRYLQRLTRADALLDPMDEQMKVVFTGLFTDRSYTLVHHGNSEAGITVFAEVPYEELTTHGSDPDAPTSTEPEEIEQEEDVQAESSHEEVQHDPSLDEIEVEDADTDHDAELPAILAPPEDTDDDDGEGTGLTQASSGAPGTAPSTPPSTPPSGGMPGGTAGGMGGGPR